MFEKTIARPLRCRYCPYQHCPMLVSQGTGFAKQERSLFFLVLEVWEKYWDVFSQNFSNRTSRERFQWPTSMRRFQAGAKLER